MNHGLPYFKFYPQDFVHDEKVERMTPAQVGAYIRLICRAWTQKPPGTIPDDDATLSYWSGMTPAEWSANKAAILACFGAVKGGRYAQKRLCSEYKSACALSETRRNASAFRWRSKGNANAMQMHSKPDANGMLPDQTRPDKTQTRPDNTRPDHPNGLAVGGDDPDRDWKEAWCHRLDVKGSKRTTILSDPKYTKPILKAIEKQADARKGEITYRGSWAFKAATDTIERGDEP